MSEQKDTAYKRLKRERDECIARWGEYMKRAHVAEAKIEDLKSKLEKAELEVKFVKEYLNPADTSFKQMIDAFRVLPKEKQDKLINLSQSLVDFENT